MGTQQVHDVCTKHDCLSTTVKDTLVAAGAGRHGVRAVDGSQPCAPPGLVHQALPHGQAVCSGEATAGQQSHAHKHPQVSIGVPK